MLPDTTRAHHKTAPTHVKWGWITVKNAPLTRDVHDYASCGCVIGLRVI